MSLQDLIHKVRINLNRCIVADGEGRPGEVKDSLVDIQGMILGFLIVPATAKEEPVVKEEQQDKSGRSEPETPKEEPINEPEMPSQPGHCVSDEPHEVSTDSQEEQEKLGHNQKPATDAEDS